MGRNPSRENALTLGAVGVDEFVVDRVEVLVETRVRSATECRDFRGLHAEMTRLGRRGAAGLTVAIMLKARAFVCPAGHRSPPFAAVPHARPAPAGASSCGLDDTNANGTGRETGSLGGGRYRRRPAACVQRERT